MTNKHSFAIGEIITFRYKPVYHTIYTFKPEKLINPDNEIGHIVADGHHVCNVYKMSDRGIWWYNYTFTRRCSGILLFKDIEILGRKKTCPHCQLLAEQTLIIDRNNPDKGKAWQCNRCLQLIETE